MSKTITSTLSCILLMLLMSLGIQAQLPLGIVAHREHNSRPVDNSLFAHHDAQQRRLIAERRGGQIHTPRLTLPSNQRKMPFTTTAGATFQGTLLADFSWPEYEPKYGIYEITSASPNLNCIYQDTEGIMYAEYGSAIIGNTYYLVIGYDFGGYGTIFVKYVFDLAKMQFDGSSSELIPNQDLSYLSWTNTPYDKVTKRAYGYFYTSDGQSLEFCKMDYATLNRTKIANPTHLFMVLAIDEGDGQLYGIDSQGDLYKINKSNGVETFVGNTGIIPSNFHQAAAIDSRQGKLYWAFLEEDLTSGLAEVDLHNADAFKCYEFDNIVQFGDLYLTVSGVDDYSPSMVEDLTWTCNATNPNHIDLSFTMPSLTNNGTQQLGSDLRYVVKLSDNEVVSGSASPGERMTVTVEGLPVSQPLRLGVCAANSVGEGGTAHVDAWAGFDTPAAPEDAHLDIDAEGNVSLSWTASTKGMHGGYVKPGSIRYHVYMEPGDELLTTTEATTYTAHYTPDQLRYLYFAVDAFTDDFPTPSEKTYSNKAALGEYITPAYELRFDDPEKIDAYWSVFDGNNDGNTWTFETVLKLMRISTGLRGNNDWMLSPPLYLEKGKQYTVEFDASTAYGGKMRMAYGLASNPDPASYTQLLGTTAIAPDVPTTYSALLTVEATGVYRIGLQETASSGIYTELYRFSISDGVGFDAPAAPTGLTVTAAPEGALGATISFTTPTQTLNGAPLTQLDCVQIFREGTLIGTIDQDVAPGQALSFTDNTVTEMGSTAYSVRAVNAAGVGATASANVYIGFDEPVNPVSVTLSDNGNGTVTISWQNATIGKHGGFVDVTKVENTLYKVENNQLTGKIVSLTGKSTYTYTANMEGDPAWFYIGVTAKGDNSEESEATLGRLIKGTPAGIPIEESFANQQIHDSRFWWGTPLEGAANWGLSSSSADGDRGSMMFTTKAAGDKAVVGTRKITLQGSVGAKLYFKYYSSPASTGNLTLQVDRGQRGLIDDVATYDMATVNAEGGWQQASVDLSDYAAEKYIIIRFVASAPDAGVSVGFDDFRLGDFLAEDLEIVADVPPTLLAGQHADIKVDVRNLGTLTSSQYTVLLTLNGKKLGEVSDTGLEAGGSKEFVFGFDPDITMKGEMPLTAQLDYAADQQSNNNSVMKSIIVGNYPTTAIYDLAAAESGPNLHLSWTNPQEQVRAIRTTTDDFEGYEPWLTEFEPWTCIDDDGGLTGAIFSGASYPKQGTAFSFIIFNPNNITGKATQQIPQLTPRSGNQFATAIYSVDPTTNYVLGQDNWLISPLLPGIPQTITLYVKTMNTSYPNAQVEMWYSTTGTTQDCFNKIGETFLVSDVNEWTKIQVTLPMGTTHFALRDITSDEDAFMLMVDDATFTSLGENNMEICGYNVYVDGNLHTTIDGQRTACDIGPLDDGQHQVQMTVRYGEGLESELSDVASAATAIKAITVADADSQEVTVYSTGGAIVAEGLHATRHLPKGIYIVKVKTSGEVLKMEK